MNHYCPLEMKKAELSMVRVSITSKYSTPSSTIPATPHDLCQNVRETTANEIDKFFSCTFSLSELIEGPQIIITACLVLRPF